MKKFVPFFPKSSDICLSKNNQRNKESFTKAANKLFPIGRVFASNRQLDQVAEKLSQSWGLKKTHGSKKIGCHYGVSPHKKSRKKISIHSSGIRDVIPRSSDLNNHTNCPFRIS